MNKKKAILAVCLIAVFAAWYLFRPELLFINARVNESFPDLSLEADKILAVGNFHSVAHASKGTATIHQLADGRRILRLTDFETSNGPDVRILLVAVDDAVDHATVARAGYIELGALKGNVGAQNYDIPAEVDLAKYRAVTVWCRRFSVNFGTAPLGPGIH
jgi:hypothetical protein